MKSAIQVASPPAKPLLIYDGDCSFCSLWVRRWQRATGDRVDYLPSHDPGLATKLPELRREELDGAVHLIETNGAVSSGAKAVFLALSHGTHTGWLADWYADSPAYAGISEWVYRFVARRRQFFSKLTRLVHGPDAQPAKHELVRGVFLRSVGIIYFIAFVSLWMQIMGLIGREGILPAQLTMGGAQRAMDAQEIGLDRYHLLPTFCWFDAGDVFLKAQCAIGTALAVLVIIGVAPAPCLFLLWALYLSIATVAREFLGFQWDNLLLETGFLAIFFAPLQWLPRRSRVAPPSRVMLWLLRWLLFRLMFESGCVKLLSGDPTWRGLKALDFHYETQPLPTWIGWYAHQLPHWFQSASTAVMFGIELIFPFMIFGPRRLRQVACGGFIVLQLLIFLTGNYCFFNLLVLALCVVLLDDTDLRRLARLKIREPQINRKESAPNISSSSEPPRTPPRWPLPLALSIGAIAVVMSFIQLVMMFARHVAWPAGLVTIYASVEPSRSFNSYGLFAVMTTSRREIIVEGSRDGVTWLPYEFKYKPGDIRRRPSFVEPHQPRLDWQMWFAALGSYQQNPWFVNFCVRLLQGSPPVLRSLKRNPFPDRPPRYIRALVYDYHFTDIATRRRTGAWWQRELKGTYLPAFSLPEERKEEGTPRNGPQADSQPAENPFPTLLESIGRTVLDLQVAGLPGFESALHFHVPIALGGEAGARLGGQMARLRVAIHHVGFVLGQAGGIVPTSVGQIDGAGNVTAGKIIGLADIHDGEFIVSLLNHVAQLDRACGESQFDLKVGPGRGGVLISIRCRLHNNSPLVDAFPGLPPVRLAGFIKLNHSDNFSTTAGGGPPLAGLASCGSC